MTPSLDNIISIELELRSSAVTRFLCSKADASDCLNPSTRYSQHLWELNVNLVRPSSIGMGFTNIHLKSHTKLIGKIFLVCIKRQRTFMIL